MSTIYDNKRRGPVFLEELQGIVRYRGLIYQLVRRDIVTRCKRSFLGVARTMLNPMYYLIQNFRIPIHEGLLPPLSVTVQDA